MLFRKFRMKYKVIRNNRSDLSARLLYLFCGKMEDDAKAYDEQNQHQTETGCKFIGELNLSKGDKVLDMGCGTGSVTKYIADIVGPDGQVVGIDPDAARIKIAQEKYKEINNLQFHVGCSVTGFPHDNEPYYDAHISTTAFHWVPDDEKKIYLQKAHQCLKSGGQLAIGSCAEKPQMEKPINNDNIPKIVAHPLTQDGYQKIFQEVGLFPDLVVERAFYHAKFKSYQEFKHWFKASAHVDLGGWDEAFVKEMMRGFLFTGDDGIVTFKYPGLNFTGIKK